MSETEYLLWLAYYQIESEERAGKTTGQRYSLQGKTAEDQAKILDSLLLGK